MKILLNEYEKPEADLDVWMIFGNTDLKLQPTNAGYVWEGNIICGELLNSPEELYWL